MFDIALLGTGGMMPLPGRFLTSMLCRLDGKCVLVDCGEGTQVTMKMMGWGFKNLECICFTHFHADHISGLPGLLLTIGNSCRTQPLKIIGPCGLEQVVKSLCVIAKELPFELEFIELENTTTDIKIGKYVIDAFLLDHNIKCFGYSITIQRQRKFDVDAAIKLEIPKNYWSNLQNGEDIFFNNFKYTSDMVLGKERDNIKVTYVTDTRPIPEITYYAKNSDLFICEGIYAEDEKLEKAMLYKHMIFSEAAQIAKESNVKELWLTHFSPSLTHPEEFLEIAKNIFENCVIGQDRMTKILKFEAR